MNPGIFLIKNNEELVEMNEQSYDSEKLLQTWLAKYPELLVGNQINAKEPRRFLLIEQECGVPAKESGVDRWKIDHIFLDQDSVPTMIEVKRSSDTRVRREVVGQMLDYAANATAYWPASRMRERFENHCAQNGLDAEEVLTEFLLESVEADDFWTKADKNLKERRLRLMFVADKIPPELQSIVEFLNEQLDHTEVLAIEIKQFVAQQGLRCLAPRVIGQTAKAQEVKGSRSRTIVKEEDFFAELNERSPAAAKVARRILEWAYENSLPVNWRGSSFVPILDYGGQYTHNPITVVGGRKMPRVGIKFGRMRNRQKLSEEQRLELLRKLNEIPGVDLAMDSIDRFPSIPLSSLAQKGALERFFRAIEWVNNEVAKREQMSHSIPHDKSSRKS
jgi:hypothetical protein